MIFVVSMGGAGLVSVLTGEEPVEETQIQKAYVTIDFGNYSRSSQVFDIEEGESAYDMFNKVGTITLDFVNNGFTITKVETINNTAETFNNTLWIFYVNGIINFDDPDSYMPQHGDYLDLRYEENPY